MTRKRRVPPGPRGLPLIGSGERLARDPLGFFRDMTLNYGDLSYARIGLGSFYMVNESSLIEEFLVGKHKECVKDEITRSLIPLVGHGLLTSEGELWKRQRKLAAPSFQPKRITAYADTMAECAERAFRGLRDGESYDFHGEAQTLTLEIVGKTILGVNTREEADRIARVLDISQRYFEERLYSWTRLLPFPLPTPDRLRFLRANAELKDIVRSIVKRSQQQGEEADHLLARLIRARGESGETMSEQQLHDEAVTMLLAGHETTALALTFAAYALARHPEAAARLRAELDAELGARRVTLGDLERLPYLDACMRETLRLYPPAYTFGREVISAFELGGYTLPVGSQVLISPYGLHRNPRHFPEPDSFQPERWLDGKLRALPRFAYLPFGGGPRVCIGSHFAMLEFGLLLATLVQQVELTLRPDFELLLSPVITLRSSRGLPALVQRRERADPEPRSVPARSANV